jgi:hypothetical protein
VTSPQQLLGADGFGSRRQHALLLRQHAAAQAQQRLRRAASNEGQAGEEDVGGLSWHA